MAVPYTFQNATGSLPLSQLDTNFATGITIGNTSVVLGDTITLMNNMSLANVAINSVSVAFPNGYLANSSFTLGNTSVSLGSTATTLNGLTLSNVTISTGNVTINTATVTTANVTTLNVSGNTTLGDASSDTVTINSTTTFNASPVISVTDNTNAALRITQLGTGNALLVEDSANPDATPVVIDASGNVIQGTTTSTTGGITGQTYQQHVTAAIAGSGALFAGWNATSANGINIARSTSGTIGTFATSGSGTSNSIRFYFDDGTSFVQGAQISAVVDGTAGTSDMPGRLVFSTTADGASTTTEAMRINSAQNVSIGTSAAAAGTTLRLSKSITGAVASYGILSNGTIQSDVTSQANIFTSNASTVASAFTLTNLRHFYVNQGTVGATSAITNQYGFFAESGMTGATNNYGFYGDIASGTGRYNLYMTGTADNYLAGKTGIGTTPATAQILRVGGSLTGGTSARQVAAVATIASDVTARADTFLSAPATAASAFTLGILSHYHASQGTIGATSSVTTQIGFEAESSLTGATNNYGFYGNIASGTGRYNFYAAGTADNYFAGNVLQGSTSVLSFTAPAGTLTPMLQVTAPASSLSQGISSTTNVSSANGPNIVLGKSRGASASAPTIVSSGDISGNLIFSAYDGATYLPTAYIQSVVDGTPGTNDMPGRLVFSTTLDGASSPTERMRIDSSGNVGIGTASPTAVLMLKAGTATASTAPLKFTSGTNLTATEAGVVEYDGTVITSTSNTNFGRATIPLTNYASGTGTALGTNTEATNAVLLPSANDTITLSIGTYFLDTSFIVTRGATSVTSATARINIRGTGAAVGSFSGMSLSAPTAGGATANFSFDAVNITTDNVLTAASTTAAGVYTISLRGVLKVTTSGTIIPQYSLSANINAAGTVAKVLYFRLQQMDTQSAAAAGPAGTGWA